MSNVPGPPAAFDASVKPRAERGADVGASCALVFVEVAALVAILVVWPFLDHFDLDPARTMEPVSLWRYLPAAGGVGVVTVTAAVIAFRAGAVVTVVSQGVMAMVVASVVFGGGALQSHEDERDRPVPAPSGGAPGCRSGGDNSECTKYGG
ncbi:DUF6234 family protein [Streptomyces sp. NPDC006368]|uniref:DUF6234 family protein n=1 Tax=Streptomyces sp. NPDC006368 TaxID=3156760 RepID=UPI0033B61EAF